MATLITRARKNALIYTAPFATAVGFPDPLLNASNAKMTAPTAMNHRVPTTVKIKNEALYVVSRADVTAISPLCREAPEQAN